jgi:hypothetical protein
MLLRGVKVLAGGGAIVGFGYFLLKVTTPTDEQFINASHSSV